jgi:hypothetical protein
MLTQHHHEPGLFDAGLQETRGWAGMARRFAIVALGSAGAAILLAALALLTG